MYAFPRRSVGTRKRFASPCSHGSRVGTRAGTVSVMYAFPRRSVGTDQICASSLFPCSRVGTRNGQRTLYAFPLWRCCGLSPCRAFSPSRGRKICFSLFPCSRVGTRNGQRNVCIPTQERGNEKIMLACACSHQCRSVGTRYGPGQAVGVQDTRCVGPVSGFDYASAWFGLLIPPLALLRAALYAAPSPPQGGDKRFASPCSHAPAWEQETVSVMYAFPRRSVGTRKAEKRDSRAVMYASSHDQESWELYEKNTQPRTDLVKCNHKALINCQLVPCRSLSPSPWPC